MCEDNRNKTEGNKNKTENDRNKGQQQLQDKITKISTHLVHQTEIKWQEISDYLLQRAQKVKLSQEPVTYHSLLHVIYQKMYPGLNFVFSFHVPQDQYKFVQQLATYDFKI